MSSNPILPDPDEISEDISSLYEDNTIDDSESSVHKFIESKLPDLPKDVQEFASAHPESSITQDLVFSAAEGHVYYTAAEYYRDLVKEAKKYNKFICKQTKQYLSGKRVLKNPSAGIKWSATFNPFIYVLTLKTPVYANLDDIVPADDRTMTYEVVANTAEEAHLRMATHLGFSEIQRMAIASKYHPDTMKKILSDPKYLNTIRETQTNKEHLNQISDLKYVPVDRRKMWIYEIQEKINKLQQDLEIHF